MIVRIIYEKDRVQVLELGRAMVAEVRPTLTFSEERTNATIDRALTTANPTIFVAVDGEEVVGFLVAGWIDYAACAGFYIEAQLFYVRPDKRGDRAAATLFTHFDEWAERQQPEEIYAGIAWGRRSAAGARWLRRFGFEPAGQLTMRRRVGGTA